MNNPIGIFDSGVGGLTVLRKLAELLPYENLIYLGDTARVPYGNKSPELICHYAQQCTQFLLNKSVKLIIIACNTASSVALEAVKAVSPVSVIGMIQPGSVAAIKYAPSGKIGVIGTRATIQSKAYEIALRELSSHPLTIVSQPCPLFVPLAEEGWHEHAVTQNIAAEYLAELKRAEVESLILGCTHYPLLKNTIQTLLPSTRLIDSGEEAAIMAHEILVCEKKCASPNSGRKIDCYVTDLGQTFATVASQFLGMPFDILQYTSLEELNYNPQLTTSHNPPNLRVVSQ